jgi:disulfide bond formation protein DsbB
MTPELVRRWPLILLAAGLLVLATALGSQFLVGLQPCEMCLWQRWPWDATIVIGLLAWLTRGRVRQGLLVLGGIVVLVGAAIAVFHSGVENGWWTGLTACSVSIDAATDLTSLRDQLFNTPVVRCDQAPFRLLGLSMAGFNAIVSVVVGILTLVAARRTRVLP